MARLLGHINIELFKTFVQKSAIMLSLFKLFSQV